MPNRGYCYVWRQFMTIHNRRSDLVLQMK